MGARNNLPFAEESGRDGYWVVVALYPHLLAGFVFVKSRAQSGLMGAIRRLFGDFGRLNHNLR